MLAIVFSAFGAFIGLQMPSLGIMDGVWLGFILSVFAITLFA